VADQKTTEEKVQEIIVDQLGVDSSAVTLEASFIDDLGADSLDTVELIMAIEEKFRFEIPDQDTEKLTTVSAAIEYVKARLAKETPKLPSAPDDRKKFLGIF